MDDKIRTLYELCETVSRELEKCNEKIRMAGGKLSPGDVEYLDKITHMLKSIKTTIAMMEAEDGYSENWGGMSYADGRGGNRGGYGGNSMARGGRGGRGGRNNNPMGRNQYSREGYSYEDGMEDLLSEMRSMMGELPEEKRREVERFVHKMERM